MHAHQLITVCLLQQRSCDADASCISFIAVQDASKCRCCRVHCMHQHCQSMHSTALDSCAFCCTFVEQTTKESVSTLSYYTPQCLPSAFTLNGLRKLITEISGSDLGRNNTL